jgi:hypothetical protein
MACSSSIQLQNLIAVGRTERRISAVFKGFVAASLLALVFGVSLPLSPPAFADETLVVVADDTSQYPIQPSEAANIARDANPDSKVLNVKLLPNGVYAVTLKKGGSVSRVMVDATSGAISS